MACLLRYIYVPLCLQGLSTTQWRKCINSPESLKTDPILISIYNSKFSFDHSFACCAYISLVNCNIDDGKAEILAKELNSSLLENVILDFNRISDSGMIALCTCIAKCSVLREISIQCNNVSDIGAMALANVLGGARTLKKVDLQGNFITNEGAVAIAKASEFQKSLKLYLCGANITEEGVQNVMKYKQRAKVRAIEFESVSWRRIQDAGIDFMIRALTCGKLPMLQISEHNIETIEKLAESQCILNVGGLQFWGGGFRDDLICKIIKKSKNIQTFSFESFSRHNKFDINLKQWEDLHSIKCYSIDDSSTTIRESIKVEYLDIKVEALHIVSNQDIISSLDYLKNFTELCTLRLERCLLDSGVNVAILCGTLVHCKKLLSLNLSMNKITDTEVMAFTDIFSSLCELNLAYNKISSDGIMSLAKCTKLRKLNLSRNVIQPGSQKALSTILNQNPIRHLNLSSNKVYLSNSATLMDSVCSTLQVLKLHNTATLTTPLLEKSDFNQFQCYGKPQLDNSDGVSNMMADIVKCKHLVKLDISTNNIGTHGMGILAEGLCCKHLCNLNLSCNKIESGGVPAILTLLDQFPGLELLDLCDNKISVDGASLLVEGWHHSNMLCLSLGRCFDYQHEKHLINGSCISCQSCNQFLKAYNSNDFLTARVFMYTHRESIMDVSLRRKPHSNTLSDIPKKISF